MRPADRLFKILLYLGRGRVATAHELASSLAVSERTIYRDIKNLIASGIPIDGEAGVGYRLHHSFQVPPMMFDEVELQALAFGAQVAQTWGDEDIKAAAARILAKVDAVLPERLRPVLSSQTLIVPRAANYQSETTTQTLGAIRQAVNGQLRLSLSYADGRGAQTERVVWPLTLTYWGYAWMVGAWCELREAFRSFRVDRIVEATALDSRYPDQAGRRFADYVQAMTDD